MVDGRMRAPQFARYLLVAESSRHQARNAGLRCSKPAGVGRHGRAIAARHFLLLGKAARRMEDGADHIGCHSFELHRLLRRPVTYLVQLVQANQANRTGLVAHACRQLRRSARIGQCQPQGSA
ncbi:hypothetical protein D9M69_625420 [compost metagenome]